MQVVLISGSRSFGVSPLSENPIMSWADSRGCTVGRFLLELVFLDFWAFFSREKVSYMFEISLTLYDVKVIKASISFSFATDELLKRTAFRRLVLDRVREECFGVMSNVG